MFKTIKFNLVEGSVVSTMEGKNVTLEEVIRLLKDENVISITATKMTPREYLKSKPPVNI